MKESPLPQEYFVQIALLRGLWQDICTSHGLIPTQVTRRRHMEVLREFILAADALGWSPTMIGRACLRDRTTVLYWLCRAKGGPKYAN